MFPSLFRNLISCISELNFPEVCNKSRPFHSTNARMVAKIINGKKIAKDVREELKADIERWREVSQRSPTLRVILVEGNEASEIYVKNKMKAARRVGIESTTERYPASITEKQLIDELAALNNDSSVDAILVQLPLPKHISEKAICNAIIPYKDVDGFHLVNMGRLCLDMKSFIPCTTLAVQEILKRTGVETFGKHAVVCGRSKNVGMPIAVLLHADGRGETLAMDATTTICHRYTPPDLLEKLTKTADIIVAAAGVPNLIKPSMVKPGACVIDVGITRILNPETRTSTLVGDVDFEGVRQVAGYITPVPGGVGPVTVAMLLRNTLFAAKGTDEIFKSVKLFHD